MTVPKAVRYALGISEGDRLVFRVEGNRAIVARTPDLLELAGSIEVPAEKRSATWEGVIRRPRRGEMRKVLREIHQRGAAGVGMSSY